MPKIRLSFTGQYGEVEGRVHIIGQTLTRPDFHFRIDTASDCTLLLDMDFRFLCWQLGWRYHEYPNIIHWISLQQHLFVAEGPATSIAGESDAPVFRIINSDLSLLDPVHQPPHPPRRWDCQKIVCGTFSSKFLKYLKNLQDRKDLKGGMILLHQFLHLEYPESRNVPEDCPSHISLLGVDKLNKLRKFVWAYPRNRITLVR